MAGVYILTIQMSAPLLHHEHPPPVLFPGLDLLVMGGGHGVKLPFPVLQLSHQQLELSSLPLDGRAAQVAHMKLLQKGTHNTSHTVFGFASGLGLVGCDGYPDLISPQRAASLGHPGQQLEREVKTSSSF